MDWRRREIGCPCKTVALFFAGVILYIMDTKPSAIASEDLMNLSGAGSAADSRLQETASTGWVSLDVDSLAARVTTAFHEAKKKAIRENIEVFGRAKGALVKPK